MFFRGHMCLIRLLQTKELVDELLGTEANLRPVHQFSCGHIVPRENLLPLVVTHSSRNLEFNLVYSNRSSSQMV
jgi:hypothetical protein